MSELAVNIVEDFELDDEIAVIRGSIWDNCRDYCYSCQLVIPENIEVRTKKKCPKCKVVLGFIPKAGIDDYLKTLDEEEREAREFGKWHHLSGLVYKTLERPVHTYDDFKIPSTWMKVEGLDPHDARASCWLFGAVSPEEIEIFGQTAHRIYFYDYIFSQDSIEGLVRQVEGTRSLHNYDQPQFVMLDKKWGTKENIRSDSSEMDHKTWQTELERMGIKRIKLSQSDAGDVGLGHKIVREYLKPHYSKLTQSAKPGIMFAKKGCGGTHGPIHYMFNYQYDDKSGKPKEDFKDWPDVCRYIAMEIPKYREPEADRNMARDLEIRMERAYASRRAAA